MKTIRKFTSAFVICMLTLLAGEDIYAQYFGTSRRVARRTARRTSRRVNYRQDYYGGGYYGGAYYGGGAGYITTLPGGCTSAMVDGITYQNCGGTYYQPFYEGTQLVYKVVVF